MTMIPYGRQDIRQNDIEAVIDVLNSDYLTQGPVVPQFEKAIAAYCGISHAIAVNSATSALHIACLALGLGDGDYLWTSPITFVASANCGLYCGAKIDFIDIDPQTYNLCPIALKRKLIAAEQMGRLPKIVVAVHMCGQSCNMEAIYNLSLEYGFKIIEDASHAIGGKYMGDPIGTCRYSDVTVLSFHPVKIITTAEGGMALTNDNSLAHRMELLRSHGITRNSCEMTHASDGPWYYQQVELGFNYRMTELQAALGLSQLPRLDFYVRRRHEIATRYDDLLKDLPVTLPWRNSDAYSAFHLYVIRLQLPQIAASHREVFESLREQGIGVNLHYIPVYTQPIYKMLGYSFAPMPEADSYYAEAISLPIYPTLTIEQQNTVIHALHRTLRR